MKKIFFPLLLFNLFFFLFPKAYAANICTENKYDELKRKASTIQVEWELKFDEKNNNYFEVEVSGVDKDLILIYNDIIYEPANGYIKIFSQLQGGNTYQFKFYGGYDNPCAEEYVYTKTLQIPKYNKYSELDVCKEYSKWELCDKWYSSPIADEEEFYQKLEEYKEKIKSGEIVIEDDNKNTNLIITVGIVSLILVCIAGVYYFKFYKKKK